ncbi:MAG: BolA family protein [Pseudomonadota bacterium]
MEERIIKRLNEAFSPSRLEVIDDSEAHRGHGGWREGGGTHFNVKIRSDAFAGLSRVAAQRLVMKALKQEFEEGLHALALDARA